MKIVVLMCVCLGLGASARAQLTDLQPGRNFTFGANAFGNGHSENIDVADVDNDGDYDVGVANGGDSGPQQNRLFLNQGGSAGGMLGSFVEVTDTHFAGMPLDTSRDIEFADFENDGDFDVFIANRGTVSNGGETSRAYTNQGGFQGGSISFFSESTNDFWGTLVSIPGSDEVGLVDGEGPYRDFSCDCDFGDLNDDGQIDLFASSYGPNMNASRDSRVFLNDGSGRFDELWPWVEPGADIKLQTVDVDLADFDGDFDLDIVASSLGASLGSSLDSQARVYRSNLHGPAGTTALFTEITQTALLDTGAGQEAPFNNYETECGDLDGDGDFDIFMLNYGGLHGFHERILQNNGDLTFTKQDDWIQGEPNIDENEGDLMDFDSDGDLDIFIANFLGTNRLYMSGVAQGLDPNLGLFHRTDSTGLTPWPELPQSGNGFQSLDGECADMDNDGDPDILLSNDNGSSNRYYENMRGVPDTFAPTFERLTEPLDKSDGSETVIHVGVRDNAPIYIVNYYSARLLYKVDDGQQRCVLMTPQGSMQFRAVIPGEHVGEISYRVTIVDDAGNQGVSPTISYTQSGGTPGGWQSLSCGTRGVNGVPYLEGRGELSPDSPTRFVLRDAAPDAFALLFVSLTSTPTHFRPGTLYTFPIDLAIQRPTDTGGLADLALAWPSTSALPSGSTIFTQFVVQDALQPTGVALSNAVLGTVP